MSDVSKVRPSPIAGTWYPGEAEALRISIQKLLSNAGKVEIEGSLKGLIVPHAGHIYSGQVAAYAYNAAASLPVKVVAIVSPMHHYHPAPLLTSAHSAYQTPLGDVPINPDLLAKIDRNLQGTISQGLTPVINDQEHSLEIQLPFLQTVYPQGFELIPIMLRDQSPEFAQALAAALAECLPEQSLLIASTDLSHFFTDSEANELDSTMLKAIIDFSPEEVYRVEASREGFACGLGAVTTILWATSQLGADSVKLLKQATSAEVTGDKSSVVGYGSAAIYQSR
jgi:AmmeMemoRadiSam system protein B